MPKVRLLTHNGQTKRLSDWANDSGVPMKILWDRLNRGWAIERALAEPFDTMGPKIISVGLRLEARLTYEPNSGCWLWTGNTNHKGYGQIGVGADSMLATHRVAYETWVNEIPAGMQVLHKCDVRCCCNPDHLFIGTHQDNMNDRWAKGKYGPKSGRLNSAGNHV